MSEREFLAMVRQLARLFGWTPYHTHDSRRSAAGFPDLVLVRDRVVWAELKTDRGQPTAEQVEWLVRLRRAGQEAFLWRPKDWEDIKKILGDENQGGK